MGRLQRTRTREKLGRYWLSLGLATVVVCLIFRLTFAIAPEVTVFEPDLSPELVQWSGGDSVPDLLQSLNQLSPQAPPVQTLSSSTITPSANPPTQTPQASVCPAPRWLNIPAHPTNYGERLAVDALGRPVNNSYLIVLHETVFSGMSAINTFRTAHPRDDDQVSYHDLIMRDGTIVHLVPWEKRAYGAGNSEFRGEAVQTNPKLPSSVNNFAVHFSLETPPDGNHNRPRHSGYTPAQYRSLAWLVAATQIPDTRVTTHKAVDRASGKQDPRSFASSEFFAQVNQFRQGNC